MNSLSRHIFYPERDGGWGQKSQEFCNTSFSLSKGCEKVTIMSLLRSNKNSQSSSQKKKQNSQDKAHQSEPSGKLFHF